MWNSNKKVELKKYICFSNKTVSSFPQLLVKAYLFWEEFLKEVYHFRGIRNKGNGEMTLQVSVIQQTISSALLLTPWAGFQKIHAFKEHYMTAYYLLQLSLISGYKWLSWINILSYIITYLLATRLVFLCVVSTFSLLKAKNKVHLHWRAQYLNNTF